MAKRRAGIDPNLFARTEPGDAATERYDDTSPSGQGDMSTQRQGDTSPKVRMAFYLPQEVAEALERAYAEMRASYVGPDRRNASRSAIVEAALRAALGMGDTR